MRRDASMVRFLLAPLVVAVAVGASCSGQIGFGGGGENRPDERRLPVDTENLPVDTENLSDGEYLPIVKVRPDYPKRAIRRGIQGHVVLEFTVTKTGSVRNPIVVESVPPGVFDRAAIDAALQFKYRPKVVNGEPVDVSGVQSLIKFALFDG